MSWIKMRTNLGDVPRVARLCDLTDSTEAAIIGGLYWLLSAADEHSEVGIMPGLTLRAIDRKTGIQGLAEALVSVGWLADHPEGVRISRFEEHNGSSAKRRSLDAQRKSTVRNVSASTADSMQTECAEKETCCGARVRERKEEEKEEKPMRKADAFARFWDAYPKKRNKGDAEKAWAKLKADDTLADRILAAVEVAKRRDDWRKNDGQYVPYPASWLNAKGWEDEAAPQATQAVAAQSMPAWVMR